MNGGGNGGESYPLAWLFTAAKTKCDAIKRGRKGFLFTIGDEAPHRVITREQAERFADISVEADVDARTLQETLSEDWHIFHLIVETASTRQQDAIKKWRELLGERAIVISDIEKLPEAIVSLMQVISGTSTEEVVSSWNGSSSGEARGVVDQFVGWLKNKAVGDSR